MSLQTYTDLTTAVPNWLARAGDSVITANVGDFVTLCEARIAYGSGDPADADATFYTRPLRVRAMETSVMIPINTAISVPAANVGGTANAITLTPQASISSYLLGQTWNFPASASIANGGVTVNISGLGARTVQKGSALAALTAGDIVIGQNVQLYDNGSNLVLMPGSAYAPLPTNFLAARDSYLDMQPRVPISYITPAQADIAFNTQWGETPSYFTTEADAIRFDEAVNQSYNFVLLYYQKIPSLQANSTNWLMTNAPNIYLFGTLLEASMFLDDSDNVDRWLRRFRAACSGYQSQDAYDRHSGAALTIKNDSGNP